MARTGTQENQQANQQLQQQQTEAFNKTNASIDKYNSDLGTLKTGQNIAQNPYQTPAYLENLNRGFATTASAVSNAGKANIEDTALRTGSNSASNLSAIQNNQRRAQQVANAGLNSQYAEDYGKNIDYQTALLNADLAPTGASNSAYGTSTSGRDSALGNLTQIGLASYGPWNAAIGALGGAAGAALSPGGAARPRT